MITITDKIGKMKPIKLWNIIDKNKNPSINEKISYVRSLRVVAQNNEIPKRFVGLLTTYANHDDKSLRDYSIVTLMMRFNKIKRIQNFLASFAKQSDENKKMVLRNITSIIKENEEFYIRILKICAKTNDKDLIRDVARNLGYLTPKYPIEVLKILQKWGKMQEFNLGQGPKWAYDESEKRNTKMIEKFLLDWISKEKNKSSLEFYLPHILVKIYKGKDQDLLRLLKKIDLNYKWRAKLVVKTIDKLLSKGFEKIQRNESFLNSCDVLLMKIAKQQKLEICVDSPIEKESVRHTRELIHAITHGKKRIPSSEIKKNLQYFPNVVSFFGERRLCELIESKPCHPLIHILSQVPVNEKWIMRVQKRIDKQDKLLERRVMLDAVRDKYYPRSIFFDMDESFAMLGKQEQGISSIRKAMLNKNTFFPTLMELNVAVRFKKKYCVTLQPSIKNKKLDVMVDVDGTECLFEIYSPEDRLLKYVQTAESEENKAKRNIRDKVDQQLKFAEGFNHPVILIIDKSGDKNVDNTQILNSLFGTYQWIVLMNKENGEIVKEYPTRKKDSIYEISPCSKIISAVILLNRDMDSNDLKIRLYGEIIPNPNASIPLDKEIIQKIEDALFNQPIF